MPPRPAVAAVWKSGTAYRKAATANVLANVIRNVWANAVIFCGHFPDGAEKFTAESLENETQGQWYLRQMLGSANISGSPLMHIMTGNLSHQIEHHFYPDVPAHRYAAIAVEVREICARYGQPYNTGSLPRQFGEVVWRIIRHAFPSRPKRARKAPEGVLQQA